MVCGIFRINLITKYVRVVKIYPQLLIPFICLTEPLFPPLWRKKCRACGKFVSKYQLKHSEAGEITLCMDCYAKSLNVPLIRVLAEAALMKTKCEDCGKTVSKYMQNLSDTDHEKMLCMKCYSKQSGKSRIKLAGEAIMANYKEKEISEKNKRLDIDQPDSSPRQRMPSGASVGESIASGDSILADDNHNEWVKHKQILMVSILHV